jgi:uncharacterized membrane protein YgaE (UPF0421/DUF939 family)
MLPGWRTLRTALIHSGTLAAACVISYWLVTHLLTGSMAVSRDDDLHGGMWAAISTLFVFRFSYEKSIGAAVSRMASTLVSFVLCFVYLLLFPFHLWGLAALIGIGAVAMSLIGRPDDIGTTGIATVVVMVVASADPRHAWVQPVLRMLDTAVGVGVGVVGAWLDLRADAVRAHTSHRVQPAAAASDRT